MKQIINNVIHGHIGTGYKYIRSEDNNEHVFDKSKNGSI